MWFLSGWFTVSLPKSPKWVLWLILTPLDKRNFSSSESSLCLCECWGRVCRSRRSSNPPCLLTHIRIDPLSSLLHVHELLWIICSPWEKRALNSNHLISESMKTILVALKKLILTGQFAQLEKVRDYTLLQNNSHHPTNSSWMNTVDPNYTSMVRGRQKNSIYQNQKVNSTVMVTIMFQDVFSAWAESLN